MRNLLPYPELLLLPTVAFIVGMVLGAVMQERIDVKRRFWHCDPREEGAWMELHLPEGDVVTAVCRQGIARLYEP